MDNGITAGVPFRMAVTEIEKTERIDSIVCLLPTSALRFPWDIDGLCRAFDNREKGIQEVGTAAPIKECFYHHNEESYHDRFKTMDKGPVYYAKNEIRDKFWNYSRMMGGWNIAERDWLMEQWHKNPDTDIEIDTSIIVNPPRIALYAVHEWQCTDIDYPEDAEVLALFMEHFILKGRGPMVYYDYARGNHG
jgi:hypothetical protein